MMPMSAGRNADSRLESMGMGQNGVPGEPGKVPMADVRYRQGDEQASCGVCANFVPPDACQIVAGRVEPQGMCDAYEPPGAQQAGPPMSAPMPAGPPA